MTRNVKRWRDGTMIRRWVGLALGRAATRFRRIKGHRELDALAARAADGHDGGGRGVSRSAIP